MQRSTDHRRRHGRRSKSNLSDGANLLHRTPARNRWRRRERADFERWFWETYVEDDDETAPHSR